MRDLADRAAGALPEFGLPKIGRVVEIPVYMVHNTPDPDDYFFIFDFEQFVERSRDGLFVRPRLRIWAGRDDFRRDLFARQFREAFGKEFDIARAQLWVQQENAGRGWFDWLPGFESATSFVANVVLLVALTAGRAVLTRIGLPGLLAAKSDDVKLEESIEATKQKVDAALLDQEVALHRDLVAHAWSGTPPASVGEIDHDAWPLPANVSAHLAGGTGGSG